MLRLAVISLLAEPIVTASMGPIGAADGNAIRAVPFDTELGPIEQSGVSSDAADQEFMIEKREIELEHKKLALEERLEEKKLALEERALTLEKNLKHAHQHHVLSQAGPACDSKLSCEARVTNEECLKQFDNNKKKACINDERCEFKPNPGRCEPAEPKSSPSPPPTGCGDDCSLCESVNACCSDAKCGFAIRGRNRNGCMLAAVIKDQSGLEDQCNSSPLIPNITDPPKASANLESLQPSVVSVGNRETGSSNYVTAVQLEEMKPYPGVDYLGVGYDAFHGNPSGDNMYMLDPGFRQPVRVLAYSMNWLTRDGKFKTPKNSVSMPLYACTRSDQYSNVADASSYASSLSVDASLSMSGGMGSFGAAFKASVGYNSAKNEARSSSMYRFESKSYCLKYKFYMIHQVPKTDELTPQFVDVAVRAVKSMGGIDPTLMGNTQRAEARSIWLELFHFYGTHYVTELTVGGKVIYTRYVTQEKMQSQFSSGTTVSASGGVNTLSFQASASVSVALASKSSSESGKEFGGSNINIMGGVPVGDASTLEGFANWAKTVDTNPMPVKYNLAPFSEFAASVITSITNPYVNKISPGTNSPRVNPCESTCYTAGEETKNGLITVTPLNVSWVSRCGWTTPECWGCKECTMSPPHPVQPPAAPPTSPAGSSPPPPPPRSTEELFRAGYEFFVTEYGHAAQQEAILDTTQNVLSLGGGACVNKPEWNNAMATTDNKNNPFPSDFNWGLHNTEDLENMCRSSCFGTIGKLWKQVTAPPDVAGATELQCPALGEKLHAQRTSFTDAELKVWCIDTLNLRPQDAARVYITSPRCTVKTESIDTDTCWFRKPDCEKCDSGPGTCCNCYKDQCDELPASKVTYYQPQVATASDIVAAAFYPPNPQISNISKEPDDLKTSEAGKDRKGPGPECICYTACPAVQYYAGSMASESRDYGLGLTLACGPTTSHICSLGGHTPWPIVNQPPSPPPPPAPHPPPASPHPPGAVKSPPPSPPPLSPPPPSPPPPSPPPSPSPPSPPAPSLPPPSLPPSPPPPSPPPPSPPPPSLPPSPPPPSPPPPSPPPPSPPPPSLPPSPPPSPPPPSPPPSPPPPPPPLPPPPSPPPPPPSPPPPPPSCKEYGCKRQHECINPAGQCTFKPYNGCDSGSYECVH